MSKLKPITLTIGIDPGIANIGYAFLTGGSLICYGRLETSKDDKNRVGVVAQKFHKILEGVFKQMLDAGFKPSRTTLFIENVPPFINNGRGFGGNQGDINQATGAIVATAFLFGITKKEGVSANKVKKYFTSNGKATKEDMLTMVSRLYPIVLKVFEKAPDGEEIISRKKVRPDTIDAIAIADFGYSLLCNEEADDVG